MQRHNSSLLLATLLSGCLWPCGYWSWKARWREFSQPRLPTPSTHKAHGDWCVVMQVPIKKKLSSMVSLGAVSFLHFVHSSGDTSALTKSSEHLLIAVTAAEIAICPHKHLLSLASQNRLYSAEMQWVRAFGPSLCLGYDFPQNAQDRNGKIIFVKKLIPVF